jgi:hypothetical protein
MFKKTFLTTYNIFSEVIMTFYKDDIDNRIEYMKEYPEFFTYTE